MKLTVTPAQQRGIHLARWSKLVKYLFWGRTQFFRVTQHDWKIRIGYMATCDKVFTYVTSVKFKLGE